ncbi:DUF3426 domain-containing protein [Rhodocyclus tenuis]|uniref:DUF3426 domain-containing protein n=1 Tax=Rhodocyclus gracilis TaxID=2929842 RepID=A0ABX0WKY4_9RHOO|nr:DUF3426 domain-containing protein [Rhodocyclus gracilis]
MKTRCPACTTTFRVVPDQLKARAGKVRCGQCGAVFNALDQLQDDLPGATPRIEDTAASTPTTFTSDLATPTLTLDAASAGSQTDSPFEPETPQSAHASEAFIEEESTAEKPLVPHARLNDVAPIPVEFGEAERNEALMVRGEASTEENALPAEPAASEFLTEIADDAARVEPPLAAHQGETAAATPDDGGVLPRQMTEIPGYSKWSEGARPTPLSAPETPANGLFVAVAVLLGAVLAGQVVFQFRSELAASQPSLRPALERFADVFNATLPPLRRAEQLSIEGSDLQADPANASRLQLTGTLANRAPYAQALPLLELTLTDIHDQVVARKVFPPEIYLSDPASVGSVFAARSEIALRLSLEAKDIGAAGYRLYVFYP